MSGAPRDYLVSFIREEEIARIANEWRRAAGIENSPEFNIVAFVEDVLSQKLKKGPLRIKFFDMRDGDDPAFVTFQPHPTLHIDRDVMSNAKIGDPESKGIVAHEVGHIILHDHHAKAFSHDRVNPKFYVKETSAEWQANTFVDYFLLPDHIVIAYSDVKELAKSCSVTQDLARHRLDAVAEARRPRPKIEGDFCIKCGQFTVRRGGSVKCDCEFDAVPEAFG
jgi:Zn-dependent peptidase ImmA (M78 family)